MIKLGHRTSVKHWHSIIAVTSSLPPDPPCFLFHAPEKRKGGWSLGMRLAVTDTQADQDSLVIIIIFEDCV